MPDEDDIDSILDEYESVPDEEDGSQSDDPQGEEPEEGVPDEMVDALIDEGDGGGEIEGDEAMDMMGDFMPTPDDMSLIDKSLDQCLVEVEDEPDVPDEDDSEEEDEEEEGEVCEGSTPQQITPLGQEGDLEIMLNFIVADAIQSQTDEMQQQENSDFVGSHDQGIEVHVKEEDFETAHEAIATVMTPTEDKLRRDPDAEITPDSLYARRLNSCHPEFDLVRTFDMARAGSSDTLEERGPWTNRRFNIQDLIAELGDREAEAEEGFMLVVHACPFQ
jgi:hypothetical protein